MSTTYIYRVLPEHRSGRGTYWRPNAAGYTDDINEAGRYSSPDRVRGSETAEAVPLADEIARIGALDGIGAKIRADHPHLTYTAEDLVRRAVHAAGQDRPSMVRWAHIRDIFGTGSGVAISICEACGADPFEHVGLKDEPNTDGEE